MRISARTAEAIHEYCRSHRISTAALIDAVFDDLIRDASAVDGHPMFIGAVSEMLAEPPHPKIDHTVLRYHHAPPGAFCAVCTADVGGDLVTLLPLGKGNAMVTVCLSCDTDHPRQGRYSYDGGRSVDRAGVFNEATLGEGNRRGGKSLRS